MSRTVRVGLVGTGIGASLSPALHRQEGAAHGLDYRYELFDLAGGRLDRETLAGRVAAAQDAGFAGLNITHPFKQMAVDLVDTLSPDAAALGAINTIVFAGGSRMGYNTDWSGYAAGFRRSLPDALLGAIVQLGVGGAGAAVAHALMTMGARSLSLIDREPERAEAAAAALSARFGAGRVFAGGDLERAIAAADGFVNATPIGMAAYPGLPLPETLLRPDLWVSEIVYFPLDTALLQAARRRGCRVSDGGGMAVFQAAGAFRLFTGLEADACRMLTHFAELQASKR
ncbi:shikimate dehydrogenase [Aurantimonas sp. HBX-1]|uniref:shikimate dehydrogenase n=1 Tax=Aurantimonas sp. HBX-1 TaxID=2906072 RepID=UPI001F186324|nr:shikimate dehydrogenase [Aurantimonas sp. HBX-1]UIJ72648.1 shikimate dehydrogenase [Aurantimonas sp. HBX-1]